MEQTVPPAPCITLLTDFGERDGFAGVMHGIILGINPGARIVDLSHNVPPQDIDAAAYVLAASYAYFPTGTIHAVVVDPGVGSDRAVLCVETPRYRFLAPDNGVLTPVLRSGRGITVRRVANRDLFLPDLSHTFHGRDIFAPVAAHLSLGIPPEQLGPVADACVKRTLPAPRTTQQGLRGRIQYIDRFGNAVTNIQERHLTSRSCRIQAGSANIRGISGSYASVSDGRPVALINSAGFLEIAVANGSAAGTLGLAIGAPVILTAEK